MLATASWSACPAAPSAWFAWPCSSARSRAAAFRCSWVISSSLSPSSLRSSLVCSGSPPGLASGSPVAARDSDRASDASDAARCSLAGSSCARTWSSIEPSWARFRSRSSGRDRSCSASCRSSSASRVRGSSASTPLSSRSLATSSIRSAWRCASSRIWRFCAITASCGLGSSTAGISSTPATSATIAGRTATRGRNTLGSIVRSRPTASRRWRRTNRASAAPSSNPSPTTIVSSSSPGGGAGGRRHRLGERERRGQRVAGPTLGVEGEGGLADGRSSPGDEPSRTRSPTTGTAAASCGAHSSGQTRIASASTDLDDGHARRGRTTPAGRTGGTRAAGAARRARPGASKGPGRARRPVGRDRRG